jgi:hypothetical protein
MNTPEILAKEAQRLDAQLCFALYSASHGVGRAYRKLLAPFDIT